MEKSGTNGVQNSAAWLIITVLSVIILKSLDFIFIPFSIALLVFFALGIPVDFLKRFRIPSWLRIMLVVLAMLGVIYLCGRLVQANAQEFVRQLPQLEKKFWDYTAQGLGFFDMNVDEAKTMIAAFVGNLDGAGIMPVGGVLKKLGASFFEFLGNFFWVLLFLGFILAERESWEGRLVKALGRERSEAALAAGSRISQAIEHYLGLKTMISLITGGMAALILWLFGVEFALLWGVLTFFLNFIPNIGSLIATVPPVAMALFQFGSVRHALLVAGVLILLQMVVGNFLEPKLMGTGLNLSPLVVLLALIFWGWLWGPVGMLLAVPLTAVVKIALEQNEATRPVAGIMSGE
ncbi:MAG: AI-2E family transporter [Desulfobulbaceae bacterium]|nr:AI-2E family transporter [Desulfobulbaceae bacterium]HIJ79316.1 AI-2E family transporter [Deltaproteobacteria bacterium]